MGFRDSCVAKTKFREAYTYDFSKLMKPGEVISPPLKAIPIEDQMRAIDPSFFIPMKGFCSPPKVVRYSDTTLKEVLPVLKFEREWSSETKIAFVRPSSEIHTQQTVMRLLGGGRKNRGRGKEKKRKTDVDAYLDLMMSGRKAIKLTDSWFIPRAIGQERCPPWTDLVKVLTDLFYSSIMLDETVQDHEFELCESAGGSGQIAITLDVFSKIDVLLQALTPEARSLYTTISPMIGGTPPGSLVRYVFRADGKFLTQYFVSDVVSGPECTQARAHNSRCACVIQIRGIGPFFGFGAEFAANSVPSKVAFMYDIDSKFVRKKDVIYTKGVRHGFNFTERNMFDIQTIDVEDFGLGSRVLTSIHFVHHKTVPVLAEKTKFLLRVGLAVGHYEFVAFPSASEIIISNFGDFDDITRLPNAIIVHMDVVKDGHHEVRLSQKVGGTDVADAYWYIAWHVHDKTAAFSSFSYYSFQRRLLGNVPGRICPMVVVQGEFRDKIETEWWEDDDSEETEG